MSTREKWLMTYRVVRSVLFTAIVLVAILYVGLYVTLSVPAVQRKVRDEAVKELSRLLGSRVEIGEVAIYPFNEVMVSDVDVYQPGGADAPRTIHVEKLGAGISIWNLISGGEIVITYAELIGLQADIWQSGDGAPLNIQFIIDAFAPADPGKPPARFDLRIRNIVIRKSSVAFDRLSAPRRTDGALDPAHIRLTGINADVALPRLSNDRVEIDLRRLALSVDPGFEIRRLSTYAIIDHGDVTLRDFRLFLPNSRVQLSDLTLPAGKFNGDFRKMLEGTSLAVEINGEHLVPAEFAIFYPPLASLQSPYTLDAAISGNSRLIHIDRFMLKNPYEEFRLSIDGAGVAAGDKGLSEIDLPELHVKAGPTFLASMASVFIDHKSAAGGALLRRAGSIDLTLRGMGSIENNAADVKLNLLSSGYGDLDLDATLTSTDTHLGVKASVSSPALAAGELADSRRIGTVQFTLDGDVTLSRAALRRGAQMRPGTEISGYGIFDRLHDIISEGNVNLAVPAAEINGYQLHDLNLNVESASGTTTLLADCTDENLALALNGELTAAGSASTLKLDADFHDCIPRLLLPDAGLPDAALSTELAIDLTGNNADNLRGSVLIDNFRLRSRNRQGRDLTLNHLGMYASQDASDGFRHYTIDSDWLRGNIGGDFTPTRLPHIMRGIIAQLMPAGMTPANAADDTANHIANHTAGRAAHSAAIHAASHAASHADGDVADARGTDIVEFDFRFKRGGSWAEYLNLPVRLLYEADLSGEINEAEGSMNLALSAPYIQQGRDKLIRNTAMRCEVRQGRGELNFFSCIPTKKGVLDLSGDVVAGGGAFDITLGFNREKKGGFYGDFMLGATIERALNPAGYTVSAHIQPSSLYLNGTEWEVGESDVTYAAGQIDVKGFSIAHADQYVTIGGVASTDNEKEIVVNLSDIDLDYIFDTLNINYVAFGGLASGEAVGRGLLSRNPEAYTRRLEVKNLSYNHAVLGDGTLTGRFNAQAKRIGITADVAEEGRHVAYIDGGIWLGRDSLAFDFDADKVRIGFLQPFMSAFSSKVEGRASGKASLYGTFSDIDMKGRLFADTIRMKVDYTNVTYCGSDSVIIDPGHIRIPAFRLHDDFGHSAVLRGDLNHRYFHDPDFRFTISGARNLLVYDTDATHNPVWYGRIFGTGGGRIIGRPGYVGILADMTTDSGSTFTFVLSDTQEALDYKFLTFTDRRKAEREAEEPHEPDEPDEIVAAFRKKVAAQQSGESTFGMDIRATITPAARLTLVMDPVAGDKITARGDGAMNMTYSSESDDLRLYGKYTLQNGTYNFSLQDLILKDFIIKPGSSISFNGDPLNGLLNIRAAYRVNTNLTDLDKSFSTDRDLNRTNVPVDAMLLLSGEMTQPDINFDIELPTLNDEVTQKVRSIISSEDMMNRQIIYLLALNRFYTPEYMGSTTNGGEWASVASSTLSSQLTNMLGQLTDKVNIAPSLRSDKGDFSDLEVDLALSSRLFNNRLLINGNFGYRDRTSSSTTFIGDFDIEYLLNRSGNFRLKAYNHFNDQNYYLKSALTTQGIGVIWRRDFSHLFGRRRQNGKQRKKHLSAPSATSVSDSTHIQPAPLRQ